MVRSAAPPYVTPDRRASGAYATPARRVAAGAIDWTICFVVYLVVSIPAGVIQIGTSVDETAEGMGFVLGQVIVAAALVGYWAGYLRTGSTLGMRAVGIETVVTATGRDPGWARSLLRAGLAVGFAASTYLAVMAATGDRTDAWSSGQELLADVVTAAALVAAVGKLPMLWTTRQTLWDRLLGLAVVDALVPTAPGSVAYDRWLEGRARREA
jgi:uncharacterized RDD family membrane protein YckC